MPISFSTLASTSADGTTASVNVSTVSGRLYAVASSGCSNNAGGNNHYDSLVVTTNGPSVTQRQYQRSYTTWQTPLAAIDTFVGNGSSVTVTVTMGNVVGSPNSPVVAIAVIEVTGSVAVDRSAAFNLDVGAGAWTTSQSIVGAPVTGNRAIGVINTTTVPSLASIAPNGGETELFEVSRAHAGGGGFSAATTGANLNMQVEHSSNLTCSWSVSVDEYRTSIVMLEFVEDLSQPAAPTPFASRPTWASTMKVR